MRFGRTTVVFVAVTEDLDNRDRYNNPQRVRTEIPVPGCRFRPLTAEEKFDFGITDTVSDTWKCTAPPVAAVMNAKSTDEVKANGVTYQIVGGPRVFTDLASKPFKVTIICQRQIG